MAAHRLSEHWQIFQFIKTKPWHPEWVRTRLDHINYHFRQDGEHHYAYDEETLALALRTVGFIGIRRREFDPAIDAEARRVGTLYMTATKPEMASAPQR